MLEGSVTASFVVGLTWALAPHVGITLLLFAAAAFVAATRTVAPPRTKSDTWSDPARRTRARGRRLLRPRGRVRWALPRLNAPVRLRTADLPHPGRAPTDALVVLVRSTRSAARRSSSGRRCDGSSGTWPRARPASVSSRTSLRASRGCSDQGRRALPESALAEGASSRGTGSRLGAWPLPARAARQRGVPRGARTRRAPPCRGEAHRLGSGFRARRRARPRMLTTRARIRHYVRR
jgi:hypothetical protein